MNASLLNRSLGVSAPQEFQREQTTTLLHALQPTSTRFTNQIKRTASDDDKTTNDDGVNTVAHAAGVSSIAIDKFEGRYLLSGGSDSSISIWDLEAWSETSDPSIYRPLESVQRTSSQHRFGITHLSYYPFDSLAFLSSSYDHTVKIHSSETLTSSATFNLESIVYSHDMSPIAQHLLVACATQNPTIRLVDLNSGASSHALVGHSGAVVSVAWSPVDDYILASGGTDGTVRFWDIRRSASELGVLDMEDAVGIHGYDGKGTSARPRGRGKAHSGVVNGVVWSEDGRHLVTTGHDQRVRVWNTDTGANTLASFGPLVKNSHLSALIPLIAPKSLVPPTKDILFFPNPSEILVYEMFEGKLMRRLRPQGGGIAISTIKAGSGQRTVKNRTTSLAWRADNVEVYSAHADGTIRAWKPQTIEDKIADAEEEAEIEAAEQDNKKKRQGLEDIFQGLTKKRITFS
ncbi:WD40 repeat-like protein [Patellaria atrata CBS 101060]|uniref:WD40 repeat-like protein n=1 Tax=Patellaria atrata CBS 101060 TaxID=1346257 RepID=A0A9P4VUV4_9PEZI|nr:WD40 repeat-like protein [Patellaria atrata CBS 101060]